MGHSSVADGLAACYMGDNRYLFFSVTDAYEDDTRGLNAYIVNMNADDGRGAIVNSFEIESPSRHMSESIELIAKDGTANQYWLVYAHCSGSCPGDNENSNELRVRLIDVGKTSLSIGEIIGTATHTPRTINSRTFTLKTSRQHDHIAMVDWSHGSVEVFDFLNSTGMISNKLTHSGMGDAYGLEFSPKGTQIYIARYYGDNVHLYQYEISNSALTPISDIQYWTQTSSLIKGGGLKLGPDDRIYVTLPYSNYVGVISNPDQTSPLSARYDPYGLQLGVTYTGLQFSTGLTRPSLMACNMNNAPETQADFAKLCITPASQTVKVGVLANDTDLDDDAIYLTDARFLNVSDESLATLAINATSDSLVLTLKPDAGVPEGHVFSIIYDVKDNGLPASQCATGLLNVTASSPPSYPDIRIRFCPDAGSVNLSKYLDTAINSVDPNSIRWTSQIAGIPVSSPDGTVSTNNLKSSRVYTFTYELSDLCGISPKRKVYLEKLTPDRMHPLRETVVMCYKYAEAVQINQLFGIEANGEWTYYSSVAHDVDSYVSESAEGAVVMDGKAIYESSIPFVNYQGHNNVKTVIFIYKSDDDSCLHGKEYKVVIVLTEDVN
jgi:hypothetical protein